MGGATAWSQSQRAATRRRLLAGSLRSQVAAFQVAAAVLTRPVPRCPDHRAWALYRYTVTMQDMVDLGVIHAVARVAALCRRLALLAPGAWPLDVAEALQHGGALLLKRALQPVREQQRHGGEEQQHAQDH